jgi:lipopolysaccharide transport system ATP-binding protein
MTSLFARNGHRSNLNSQPSALSGHPSSVDDGSDTVWALKDVSFEVKQGEAVGIIGRNGAGKSTLLKIVSRITEPTSGFIDIHGRAGSLLEVGTGFQRDLTGRENIFLNGAIMGMKKAEIERKFDEIVDFSGVEKFIDTPVKRYSSGMYVRLAFAVAAHLEPEVLIVDEVLAVGDAEFQRKCVGKLENVAKEGRTVLFVSHNVNAVSNLCSRAILLAGGKIEVDGDATQVVKGYVAATTESIPNEFEQVWHDTEAAPGNDKIRLRRIGIVPRSDSTESIIDVTTSFDVEIEFWNLAPQNPLLIALGFYTMEQVVAFSTVSVGDPNWHGREVPPGLFRSVCRIPGNLFNDGSYALGVGFVNSSGFLYRKDKAVMFTVHDAARSIHKYGRIPGVIRPKLDWETTLLGKEGCK